MNSSTKYQAGLGDQIRHLLGATDHLGPSSSDAEPASSASTPTGPVVPPGHVPVTHGNTSVTHMRYPQMQKVKLVLSASAGFVSLLGQQERSAVSQPGGLGEWVLPARSSAATGLTRGGPSVHRTATPQMSWAVMQFAWSP
jgi:hypothetical protein